MKRPDFSAGDPTGRVAHDDRGNAVWEWARDPVVAPVEYTRLAIVEDEAAPLAPIKINKVAAKGGYNPYESGMIQKKNRQKRDLRELSRWIEQRKLRGEDTKT